VEQSLPGTASNILPLQQAPALQPAKQFDFLVVGSGIAGLTYALKVAEHGSVAVVTKAGASDGCTQYAQGGVCAVLDAADSVESHVRDTFVAGCFLNNLGAVEAVCREGPDRVLELVAMGAEFTRGADGELHLTREGGHTHRRIVHAADVTGREIERALVAAASAHPNIALFEHHLAVDLVTDEVGGVKHCLGMDVLDQGAGAMARFVAPVTMLATGGCGQVYPNTTNPGVTTGDGMAIAHRAKAAMANMEFVQFHPTSLFQAGRPAGARSFLISEAVRGEGGLLFNQAGERFMFGYDERLELAPRDVVARAIQDQMLGRNESHVLLDISHKPAGKVLEHFPNIAARCAESGIDITRDPIPVVPAQHYMCGGVQTGLTGQTSVAGLFACGEVACTGLHGANRLASNSLLEGLVFAARAVKPSVQHLAAVRSTAPQALEYAAGRSSGKVPQRLGAASAAWVAEKRSRLNALMWSCAGIVRNQAHLKAALGQLAELYVETKALGEAYGCNTELVELRNLVTCAELVVSSALQRRESRGLHFCSDFPAPAAEEAHETIIRTSFRRRYDMSGVRETLIAPRAPTGTLSSALRLMPKPVAPVAAPAPKPAPARARDVVLRSQKDES
jgi:L-aspartate oxidase